MNTFRVIYHEPVCPDCGSFDIDSAEVDTGDGLTETAHICEACGTAWPLACVTDWTTPASIPQPSPAPDKAVTPHVRNARGSGRNQRNNPYQLEELFVKFHRTPAGIAWRWRTELAQPRRPGRRAAVARSLDHAHLGGPSPSAGPSPWSWRCRTPAGSSPGGSGACWPATGSTGCATRPGCTPAPGGCPLILWTRPTKVGERAWVLCRAGICAEDFEAHIGELRAACYARDARVTRNRRWSHLIDHRHHPPRHPRGQRTHHIPARAADRALPAPPAAGPRPAPRRRARASRMTPARRSPDTTGDRLPRPPKEAPAMTLTDTRPLPPVPTFPFSMFDPVHLGVDEYGEHVHVNLAERNMLHRRRTRRRQVLRAEPDHRARRAVA